MLFLASNNLVGPLATELGQLTSLVDLDLGKIKMYLAAALILHNSAINRLTNVTSLCCF
jgi:hypothetical protein